MNKKYPDNDFFQDANPTHPQGKMSSSIKTRVMLKCHVPDLHAMGTALRHSINADPLRSFADEAVNGFYWEDAFPKTIEVRPTRADNESIAKAIHTQLKQSFKQCARVPGTPHTERINQLKIACNCMVLDALRPKRVNEPLANDYKKPLHENDDYCIDNKLIPLTRAKEKIKIALKTTTSKMFTAFDTDPLIMRAMQKRHDLIISNNSPLTTAMFESSDFMQLCLPRILQILCNETLQYLEITDRYPELTHKLLQQKPELWKALFKTIIKQTSVTLGDFFNALQSHQYNAMTETKDGSDLTTRMLTNEHKKMFAPIYKELAQKNKSSAAALMATLITQKIILQMFDAVKKAFPFLPIYSVQKAMIASKNDPQSNKEAIPLQELPTHDKSTRAYQKPHCYPIFFANDPSLKLTITEYQLDKKFKHAKHFGIADSNSKASREKLKQAIDRHMNDSNTLMHGHYKTDPTSMVFYNEKTTIATAFKEDGSYISGWRFLPKSSQYIRYKEHTMLW